MTGSESPIALTELASVTEGSRAARGVRGLASKLAAAWTGSRSMRIARATADAWTAASTTTTLTLGGLTVAIAMVTHLVLLLAGEPYAYPNRAAMALPLVVLAASVLGVVFRHGLARGVNDRRHE